MKNRNIFRSQPPVQHRNSGPAFRCKSGAPLRLASGLSTPIGAIISAIVLLVSLSGCSTPPPTSAETVAALQNIQELATVQYTVTKVVKANDNTSWYKPGDRKILITCQASIKAGIDLKKLSASDISVSGKTIRLQLPAPQILSVNLPPENIKVAYEDVGIFRSSFSSAEKDALMAQAEKQMWGAGQSLGIITQAQLNTQTVITNLLLQLGFEKVETSFDPKRKTEQ